ncbi:MAG: efflux RND transporter periplasmic adaptor subunit, partial [Saprospiraceae bacterium]
MQSTNQTIYSDVGTVSPLNHTITPALFATGEIAYDPRLINTISSRFTGRVEKLYVRFNFQAVKKGQRLMDIYSPEILTAQQNLIFLLTSDANDLALINSSKQQLQLLGLTVGQLKEIESTKKVLNPIPVYSPYGGHIHDIGSGSENGTTSSPMGNAGNSGMGSSSTSSSPVQIENLPSSQTSELTLKEGMYVQSGQSIFAVYNTDRVWAILNIFPKDAALIKVGDKVSMTAETSPDKVIEANINYIEPVIGQNASA